MTFVVLTVNLILNNLDSFQFILGGLCFERRQISDQIAQISIQRKCH